MKCIVCNGTGDCPNHEEHYIREDIVTRCHNCDRNGVCPVCQGTGEITEEFATYLLTPFDPRD